MKFLLLFIFSFCIFNTARAQSGDWKTIQQTIGREGWVDGKMLTITFARTDIFAHLGSFRPDAALINTSWMSFAPNDGNITVIGDFVLLDKEVAEVESKLSEGGFAITSVYKTLIAEQPGVTNIHFEGSDNAERLANHLKVALSATRMLTTAPTPIVPPTADWSSVEKIIDVKGTHKGSVLQLGIPRSETITENGFDIPPSAGVATTINMQRDGNNVAVAGSFALTSGEVQTVTKLLLADSLTVMAIHNNLLSESPRLTMLNYYGYGLPDKLAHIMKDVLDKTNWKKP